MCEAGWEPQAALVELKTQRVREGMLIILGLLDSQGGWLGSVTRLAPSTPACHSPLS